MNTTNSNPALTTLKRREQAAVFMACASVFVGFGYAIGASGLPSEAFMMCLDWAVQQGWVQPEGPLAEHSLALLLS